VTETTVANRFRRPFMSLRIILLLLVLIVAYTIGWQAGVRQTTNDYKTENGKLQKDNQQLASDKSSQATQITDLQDRLKNMQARLDTVMGQVGTFELSPNESVAFAGGRLTVGLVGTPANDRATINVNRKQQSMATGDMVSVQLSTTCQVGLKSFELLKAVVTMICAETK
jgi:cell division protein FtsB